MSVAQPRIRAESPSINSVGHRPVVFGRNPVRDWILVEIAFSRANRRAVGTQFYLFVHISRTYGTQLDFSSFFYQYCVPDGTYLDRLATPVFYDKNRIADYQQITRSSERDWAMPDANDTRLSALEYSQSARAVLSFYPLLSRQRRFYPFYRCSAPFYRASLSCNL